MRFFVPLVLSLLLAVASYTVTVSSQQNPSDAPKVDPYSGVVYLHAHPEPFSPGVVVIPSVFVSREVIDLASGLSVRVVGISMSTADDALLSCYIVPSGSAQPIFGVHSVGGVSKAYRIAPVPGRSWGMVLDSDDAVVSFQEVSVGG